MVYTSVRFKLLASVFALLLTPPVAIIVTQYLGIEFIAPLLTYFTCIIIFVYVYHTLVTSGLFFRIGIPLRTKRFLSPTFGYVIRSSLLWMFFLPVARILGDLVKWYVTGEYVELAKGDYHLYIMMLMLIGVGAGSFFSIAYLSILKGRIKGKKRKPGKRRSS